MKRLSLSLLLLVIGLIAGSTLVLRITVFQNLATSSSNQISNLDNSYLFASPLAASADGLQKIRLTVFLLDGRGLGIGNQKVEINPPSPLIVTEISSITDTTGKAVFDITSTRQGQYTITAKVANRLLPEQVRLVFY